MTRFHQAVLVAVDPMLLLDPHHLLKPKMAKRSRRKTSQFSLIWWDVSSIAEAVRSQTSASLLVHASPLPRHRMMRAESACPPTFDAIRPAICRVKPVPEDLRSQMPRRFSPTLPLGLHLHGFVRWSYLTNLSHIIHTLPEASSDPPQHDYFRFLDAILVHRCGRDTGLY